MRRAYGCQDGGGGAAGPLLSFTTNFLSPPAPENPLSEGGIWLPQISGQSPIATLANLAYNTQPGGTGLNGDGLAFFAPAFPNDYIIEQIVARSPTYADPSLIELENLARFQLIGPGGVFPAWYESNWEHSGQYAQLILISNNGFTYLEGPSNPGPVAGIQNGDVLRLAVIGNLITASHAPAATPTTFTIYAQVTDSTLTTGGPGFGGYRFDPPSPTSPPDGFGISRFSIQGFP